MPESNNFDASSSMVAPPARHTILANAARIEATANSVDVAKFNFLSVGITVEIK